MRKLIEILLYRQVRILLQCCDKEGRIVFLRYATCLRNGAGLVRDRRILACDHLLLIEMEKIQYDNYYVITYIRFQEGILGMTKQWFGMISGNMGYFRLDTVRNDCLRKPPFG